MASGMFSLSFSRMPPPNVLSPILEEEEHVKGPFVTGTNASTLQVQPSQLLCHEEDMSSNKNQSAPSDQNMDRKSTESHAGRKHDVVEVLKQKYINNEIQDIPRILSGPVKYGCLHRSRSSIVNLGSQDIRSQMNKIRLKNGTSTQNSNETDADDGKQNFRCKKLPTSTTCVKKPLRELLYGNQSDFDDYDPELAALFDDYIIECDQVQADRGALYNDTDRDSSDKHSLDKRFEKLHSSSETKSAFWTGFKKGLCECVSNSPTSTTSESDHSLQNTESTKETTQDPLLNQQSHIKMIRTNQDITHKFLRQWEQDYVNESLKDKPEPSKVATEIKCQICKRQNSALAKVAVDTDRKKPANDKQNDEYCTDKEFNSTKTSEASNNDRKEENTPQQIGSKTTLVLGSTELEFTIDTKKTPVNKGDAHYVPPKISMVTNKRDSFRVKKVDSADGIAKDKTTDGTAASKWRDGSDEYHLRKHTRDILNEIDNPRRDIPSPKCNNDNGHFNIITLAKQKLENKAMPSLIFGSPENRIKDERECGWKSKEKIEQKERKDNTTSLDEILALGNLDGWITKSKHLYDQDNLHLSSSEILHPVESFERFYSPSWTPSASTPLIPALDSKHKKAKHRGGIGNTPTPNCSRNQTPTQSTLISADLSDLEGSPCRNTGYKATAAFKAKPRLDGDYSKAADLVKLRLTKSCDNFSGKRGVSQDKGKAFANVPLAQCLSYNKEEKLKSSIQLTTSINLSEKLAQQLKSLGKDKGNPFDNLGELRHNDAAPVSPPFVIRTNNIVVIKSPMTSQELPIIGSQLSLKDDESKGSALESVNLPQISQSPTPYKMTQHDPELNKQSRYYYADNHSPLGLHKASDSTELPPVTGTSLITDKASVQMTKASELLMNLSEEDEFESWQGRSIAVRAENCASAYKFDKSDPNKLFLKARSVPHLHSVCTSCGGISEAVQNTSGHERNGRYFHKQDRSPRQLEKAIHHTCCSPCNDEKWKLERDTSDQGIGLPNLKGRKLFDHPKPMDKQKTRNSEPTLPKHKLTKTKSEEMTFKFMDQNIRLRFECEFSINNQDTLKENDIQADKTNKWLDNISMPTHRDRLKCPITRETRIYKQKGHQSSLVNNADEYLHPNTPTSSPYLEYSKRRALLRSTKSNSFLYSALELMSDTCLISDDGGSSNSSRRQFPVLPIKTNRKKKVRVKNNKNSIVGERNKDDSDCETIDTLCVKAGKLPLLKSETNERGSDASAVHIATVKGDNQNKFVEDEREKSSQLLSINLNLRTVK